MAGLSTQALYSCCVILLVLLICQANVPTEGKQMKSLKEEKLGASRDQFPSPANIPSVKRESSVAADYFGEKSQPQSLRSGSSPGIGHCFARQKGQKKSLKSDMQLGASTENLSAPATPCLPSSTPSIERKSVEYSFQDNFQPQRTGSSPGIGHCFTRKIGDAESQKLLHANCGTNELTFENQDAKPGA